MSRLRDKISGKFTSAPMQDCCPATNPVVQPPPVVGAAHKVAELQSQEVAIRGRLTDLENEFEHFDKTLAAVSVELDKARSELQRLM